ncbi:hypothetical protein HMJ29_08820 [Hymenobacter taeanensis]|uniref:Uncharacterized protein n=1 Tax=Hymenobacter taeanensis TaxID=2735321 RepID=A0A6M6BG84_9BACT|nr:MULTISPECIES: hypothetical protein [Hymenobacter]QJX47030.1 hypothetical protein HMJ29_08820 [Hymenobacter taeanensis]UOQ80908.1 hypothetical protein MUN83_19185 [Hymenobacter sp. 5414T-23]
MGWLRRFFRYLLVERGKPPTPAQQCIQFVQENLPVENRAEGKILVYYLASGALMRELKAYLPDANLEHLTERAYIMAFGAIDSGGQKYFFYEHWFHNYTFEASPLYAVEEWLPFKQTLIDMEAEELVKYPGLAARKERKLQE